MRDASVAPQKHDRRVRLNDRRVRPSLLYIKDAALRDFFYPNPTSFSLFLSAAIDDHHTPQPALSLEIKGPSTAIYKDASSVSLALQQTRLPALSLFQGRVSLHQGKPFHLFFPRIPPRLPGWQDHSMVRTKNAGLRNESEQPTRDRGKAPAVRAESSTLAANAQRRLAEALTRNKKFIPERGIPRIPDGYEHYWLSAEVAGRGWTTFCEPRDPAVIPVVREFYARVPDHQGGKVRVRGKTVRFDAVMINRFFELPVPDIDEYEAFVGSGFTDEKAEEVRQVLTDGAGQWDTHNGEFVSLKRNTLQRFAKTWFYFVVFSMMPVTHHNLCRRDPAILIYAIMKPLQINVGQLIFKGILQSSEVTKGYWFPSLVTMLCRQAGVPIEDHEETLPPGTIMTEKYIEQLCGSQSRDIQSIQRRNRACARALRAGPSAPAVHLTQEPQPGSQDVPETPAPADSGNEVLQLLRQMRRENRATRQEFRLRHEHIDANLRRNEDNMRFQWSVAGYDMSHFQSMIPWEQSSQATQWDEYVDDEESEDESAHQDSSEEE